MNPAFANALLAAVFGLTASIMLFGALTILFAREVFWRCWAKATKPMGLAMVLGYAVLTMAAATQIDLTQGVRGILPIGNGGTGSTALSTGVIRSASGTLTGAELSGDATTSGSNAVTVAKVNGTSVPTNSAADQALITSGSAAGAWVSIPNCTGACALNYSTATHTFSTVTVLSGNFSDAEVPTGLINGSNTSYSLAHTPSPAASLTCFENGLEQRAAGADFTLATATMTYAVAPPTNTTLVCNYRY